MPGLEARIADLEARIGPNSANSSRPPSADPPHAQPAPAGMPGVRGRHRCLPPGRRPGWVRPPNPGRVCAPGRRPPVGEAGRGPGPGRPVRPPDPPGRRVRPPGQDGRRPGPRPRRGVGIHPDPAGECGRDR
ncbi:MAG: DUF6444 domain-containing protein, partial [Fimbriiglobus sp.]